MKKNQKAKQHNKRIEPQDTYVCLFCLKSFQASARRWYASYCSNTCRQKAYLKRKETSAVGQDLHVIQVN